MVEGERKPPFAPYEINNPIIFRRSTMSCLCNLFDGDNMWWVIILLLLVLFCCACG